MVPLRRPSTASCDYVFPVVAEDNGAKRATPRTADGFEVGTRHAIFRSLSFTRYCGNLWATLVSSRT